MKLFGIIALTFLATSSLYAQIYKWTDSSGVVHFSDVPHSGAEKVDLPGVQTYTPSTGSAKTKDSAVNKAEEGTDSYELVAISEPLNQATIRNNQGFVPILVTTNPKLKPGDLLQIIYDGEPLGKPQSGITFALKDVKRGTHTIAVQVVDGEGNVVNTSDEITIFMHRPQVRMFKGAVPNN